MRKAFHTLSGLFGIAMFLVALFVLRRELRGHSVLEIFSAARAIPTERLALALVLTLLCYLFLTGYDLLAARRHWGTLRPLSVMLNSFICHAMSINVGFSSLTGGSLRLHYYLRKGLTPMDAVRIMSFCIVTFWLGFLTLGGAMLVLAPPAIPDFLPLPLASLPIIGAAFLIAVGLYFVIGFLRKEPLYLRQWVIPAMPPHISLAQILISVSEWLFGAAVLWALLPAHPDFSYFHLLSFYLVAHVSGLFSQVPSGLGVFESIVLALVPANLNPSEVVGSLLIYRLLFNLLPLSAAGFLLLLREVRHRRTLSS